MKKVKSVKCKVESRKSRALSRVTFNVSRRLGFTLIELLVVMAMFTVLISLGLFLSMDGYKGYMFRNERNLVVSILQKARSQAINNVCLGAGCVDGLPHGVHFTSGHYIIFQGLTYASANHSLDETINASSPNITLTGLSDVTFDQLSGSVSGPGTITVSDASLHGSIITINSEGMIAWTN